METRIWIVILIVVALVSSLLGHLNEARVSPECYLTNEKCIYPYDREEMFFDSNSLIQCCKRPHYLLQGIDVIDYCMEFKREILDKNITRLSKY